MHESGYSELVLWDNPRDGVFQVALVVKRLPASAGDEGLIPRSGRSSREYEMIAHSSSLFFY